MVEQRGVAVAVILTLITCGIYGIYWFIVLTSDVGKLSGDHEFTGGKHFLLTLVTCGIWSYVWAFQIGRQVEQAQHQRGWHASDNALIYLILHFFGLQIVTLALVQADVNKMARY
ncbi:DUF4234 domain-containing protein [Paenibacillus sp. YN15]|uniref:DUF4234 domain-containing protein n=1 Tax=Paenibacillus sp. YN15 TaxID=1742774 RepID=UPI000DCBB27B|nr:DUF4234 domain-containing protein [Paenibacillus sp. YN15]RAU99582.1 hypothetical protein DQG13_15925 [Paenibacillus sp. YN15]